MDPQSAWTAFLSNLPSEIRALQENPPEDVLGNGVGTDQLIAALSEQVSPPSSVHERALDSRHGTAAYLAAGWRHIVFRHARAVIILIEHDFSVEAQASARVAIEHAIALQRLSQAADEGTIGSFVGELAYRAQQRSGRQLAYLQELDDSGGGENAALLQAAASSHADSAVSRSKEYPNLGTTKGLFDGLPNGRHLHTVYSQLSEATHAAIASATPYIFEAARSGQPVPAAPRPVSWTETALLLCWSCWAAEDAMVRFLEDGSDLATRQIEIMATVGLASG
ncbi:DUF5677 domain-containing protein [Ornithinimicrobium sp. INDO-MA30-4]|uniref:DUF5677 domain-containing protein n=1 Tax=Ornithinimicrobium sp. INDO-MA30-4 TaxID=2908651 RepID=UPI001F2D68CA|nr:DUF5677 domain-containing protein [Ornithinimicrobium sp. INDO-MA30-4]UJH70442.1 hypothetical protein L0A91_15240 [Ornithinimicrobium sp. INDO-MA30-4]